MTDLDHRLRQLATPSPDAEVAGSAPATGALHARAAGLRSRAIERRARRRRRMAFAAIPATALLVAVAASIGGDDGTESVATGPRTTDPTTTATAAPSTSGSQPTAEPEGKSVAFGGVEGVSIAVSPSAALLDGQLVEVRIEGLDALDAPVLAICAADVTPETATSACDLRQLDRADAEPGDPASVEAVQTVAVRRTIRITRTSVDPNVSVAFDCATERVGCVLAVGSGTLPTRGALVPITFDPTGSVVTPSVEVEPAVGLQARQPVTVTATDLRPNSTYAVRQCAAAVEDGCDEMAWPTARTDAQGRLRIELPALPAIYGWQGRTDCTAEACVIAVSDDGGGERLAIAELRFAEGVTAPVPTLVISPAGPYRDKQDVTLTGEGFPPGIPIGDQIGQCPDGKDTAIELRCTYPTLGRATAADDGTFSVTVRVRDSLLFTGPCNGATGCHLGWVIPHGPTVAEAPLTFA